MTRTQFKNLHRVLRKLLQGNGPQGRDAYESRFGHGAGIEGAYGEVFRAIGAVYGWHAARGVSAAAFRFPPDAYCWIQASRALRFASRRRAMDMRRAGKPALTAMCIDWIDV